MGYKIFSLSEAVDAAVDFYGVFSGKRPRLIPTGINAIDRRIGGLGPGTVGILAGATGLGKSSVMLEANLTCRARSAIISLEDPEDVLGSRIVGRLANIESGRLRTGGTDDNDKHFIRQARERLKDRDDVDLVVMLGGKLKELRECMEDLHERGVEIVWLDYVQKMRGHHNDRRTEVATVLTEFQRMCGEYNMAGMVISQLARLADPSKRPSRYNLKESGDLENEARIIVLGYRDPGNENIQHWWLDKSTFGYEGTEFSYRRNEHGNLVPYNPQGGQWG